MNFASIKGQTEYAGKCTKNIWETVTAASFLYEFLQCNNTKKLSSVTECLLWRIMKTCCAVIIYG
jgi:hypothetical protein